MSPRCDHWHQVWTGRDPASVSWYQREPTRSLELIAGAGVGVDDGIVDVGGGASMLTVRLADGGYRDLTVVDIARPALDLLGASLAAARAGHHAVRLVCTDVLDWQPDRRFALWHDRAVNHFLTDLGERRSYAALAARSVAPGGHVVLASFAPDGPAQCSGLPVHTCEPDALAAELGPAFDLVSVTRELHDTPWHAKQSFHYLLLRRR